MKIFNRGLPHDLKFGFKRDLESITISGDNQECHENFESTSSIYIQNSEVVTSECIKAVLLLSTRRKSNIPMVIPVNGDVYEDISFTFDKDTEVDASCVAVLNGEHFVIGGYYKKRQVTEIFNDFAISWRADPCRVRTTLIRWGRRPVKY